MTIQNDAKKSNEEKYVEEKAERFMIRCPGFPPTQLDRLKDFIRTIINDCKVKVNMQYLHDNILCPHCQRYETKTLHCDYCGEEIVEVEE